MTRYKSTADGLVAFTPDEEAEWDALDQEVALAKIEEAKVAYKAQRAAEYPAIGDQLDALWKGGDAATTMLAQVQAVKAKYPKP